MQTLDLTVPQVLWSGAPGGGVEPFGIEAVPLLRHRVGPGTMASLQTFRGYVPFPAARVAALVNPVAAYLAADLALPAAFAANDMVLLDQDPERRVAPVPSFCWVVADNAGLRVRYLRRTRGALEAGRDPGSTEPGDWRPVALQGRSILDIVRARIVWIGREMETPLAGPHDAPGKGD